MRPYAHQLRAEDFLSPPRDHASAVADVLEHVAHGRPYILLSAMEQCEQGDLVVPAQFATPEQVNCMARHARGLICLAITEERAQKLELPPMVVESRSRHSAFTVSIEAREGVSTGISAYDRARTIAVAIDPRSGPADLATPGHVFPLAAKTDGVLAKPGRAEAAVDMSRIAGLDPSAAICEILNEEGATACMRDIAAFAQRFDLKICTIEDLLAYRKQTALLALAPQRSRGLRKTEVL